jgi:hypothetical protein
MLISMENGAVLLTNTFLEKFVQGYELRKTKEPVPTLSVATFSEKISDLETK